MPLLINSFFYQCCPPPPFFFDIVIVLVLSLLNLSGKNLIIPTSHYSFHRNIFCSSNFMLCSPWKTLQTVFLWICMVCNFWQGSGLILTKEYFPLTSIYWCCAVVSFISTKNSNLYKTGELQDIHIHMCIWMQVKTDNVFVVHYSYSHEPFIFHLQNTFLILNFIKDFIIKMYL